MHPPGRSVFIFGDILMALSVKLEAFEGPLDLLLHLLDKNKVSILDIPIVEITDQYMEYIYQTPDKDMEIMSEFLVMAATLLDIKARWLLHEEDDDADDGEDPREELAARLLEYKMYKCMSAELKDYMIEAGQHRYRERDIPDEVLKYEEPVDLDELTAGYDLEVLKEIFDSVIKKQADKVDPIRSDFGQIKKEEVSLDDKVKDLKEYTRKHKSCSFRQLLEKGHSRDDIVVTFLAVLEMMKAGDIRISQEKVFGDIYIMAEDKPEAAS